MSDNKRQSVRGKGREVFFSEEATADRHEDVTPSDRKDSETARRRDTSTSRQRHGATADQPTVKVTLRLPESVADELEQQWLARRARDRKATKATIVTDALRAYFGQE